MIYNPFFRKFEVAKNGEGAATYGGIAVKGIWFLALTLLGVAAYFYVPLFTNSLYLLIGAAAIAIICPILIYWIPSTTPVLGTLYSVVQGYLVGLLCEQYAKQYSGLIFIALGVTAIVLFSLLFLYASGIIKVGNKFKAFVSLLFLGSIIASGVVFVSSMFFPSVQSIIYGNGVLGIAVAGISLVIAGLNLIAEFDNVAQTVSRQLCKKYEWQAAYGLIMTVVILFLRILALLSKILGNKENNK